MEDFLKPYRLTSSVLLKNRVVLAPMTNNLSNADGTVSELDLAWYESIAKGNISMIITAAASISKESIGWKNQIGVSEDSMIPGLLHLTEATKKYNCVNILQICHTGSRALTTINGGIAYSSSSYKLENHPEFIAPTEMSSSLIEKTINDFALATERAYKAGFDGVEIHGANRYLITQFISKMTNQRTDVYGGTLENRARFVRNILSACRSKVPSDFIIGVRLTFENEGSEKGLDIDENIQISKWLIEGGINYLHVSCFDHKVNSVKYPNINPLSYICNHIKDIPIIGVGGATSTTEIKTILGFGADLVALGRILIGNPKFLQHIENECDTSIIKPPYSLEHLKTIGLSDSFIKYLQTGIKATTVLS